MMFTNSFDLPSKLVRRLFWREQPSAYYTLLDSEGHAGNFGELWRIFFPGQ